MQQLLAEKEAERLQGEIEDAMFMARQRALADAEHYRWQAGRARGSVWSNSAPRRAIGGFGVPVSNMPVRNSQPQPQP